MIKIASGVMNKIYY